MEVVNRICGDQFVHFYFVLGVGDVVIHRFRCGDAVRVSEGALFAVFERMDRFRLSIARLGASVGAVLGSLEASVRAVSMVISERLMCCPVR